MTNDRRSASFVNGLALALLIPIAAQAAGGQVTSRTLAQDAGLEQKAVAFIRTMAEGHFQAAEAEFTNHMKQAAPPAKLREVWRGLISQVGPLRSIGYDEIVRQSGLSVVVVDANFKSRALGIAVTFDSAQRIAGIHFVPPHSASP
ncbi:MAG: DUF3887 domain-containing protein [Gammaproteobacteria bacterium]|nr:DUF3887 domain-containing protein [Gammaproteobacteria bacterium]